MTRDAVARETPAAAATCRMVGAAVRGRLTSVTLARYPAGGAPCLPTRVEVLS